MADTLPWVFSATLTDSSIIYSLRESPRPSPQFRSLFWAPDLSLQLLPCCLYTYPEALQIPPPLLSVFSPIVTIDPDAQAKNQESIILNLSLTFSSYNKSVPMSCQVLHFWSLNLSPHTLSVLDSLQRSEFTLTMDCWLILPHNYYPSLWNSLHLAPLWSS